MIRLIEFAESRKEIERTLSSKTPKIIEHLLYLVLDKNNINKSHWITEVFSFISDIDLEKGSNRLPKEKFIYASTYGKRQDRVLDSKWLNVAIKNAIYKEKIKTTKTLEQIMNELDTLCTNYFNWLAHELSTIGIISLEETSKVINKLLENIK